MVLSCAQGSSHLSSGYTSSQSTSCLSYRRGKHSPVWPQYALFVCTEETVLVTGGLNGSNSDLSIPQVCSILPPLLWSPSRPMLAYGPSLTQTLACRGEYRGGRGCMEYLHRCLAYLNTGRQEKEDSRTTKSSWQYVCHSPTSVLM